MAALESLKDVRLGAINTNVGLFSIYYCLNRLESEDEHLKISNGDADIRVTFKTSPKLEVVAPTRTL